MHIYEKIVRRSQEGAEDFKSLTDVGLQEVPSADDSFGDLIAGFGGLKIANEQNQQTAEEDTDEHERPKESSFTIPRVEIEEPVDAHEKSESDRDQELQKTVEYTAEEQLSKESSFTIPRVETEEPVDAHEKSESDRDQEVQNTVEEYTAEEQHSKKDSSFSIASVETQEPVNTRETSESEEGEKRDDSCRVEPVKDPQVDSEPKPELPRSPTFENEEASDPQVSVEVVNEDSVQSGSLAEKSQVVVGPSPSETAEALTDLAVGDISASAFDDIPVVPKSSYNLSFLDDPEFNPFVPVVEQRVVEAGASKAGTPAKREQQEGEEEVISSLGDPDVIESCGEVNPVPTESAKPRVGDETPVQNVENSPVASASPGDESVFEASQKSFESVPLTSPDLEPTSGQCHYVRTRAFIFPHTESVGSEFENRPLDGYELSLTLGATVKGIQRVNDDIFVINNVCDCVVVFVVVMVFTLWLKT